MNELLKNLCQEIKQVSDRMLQISNTFKDLYNLSLNKFYSDLELFFREKSNIEIKEMNNISIELKEYLKFNNLQYISSLKELYDEFEYQDDIYYKVSQNLKQRKELLYNNGPIEKWELSENEKNIDIKNKKEVIKKILPKDTAVVKEIKKYLIYYAMRLDDEYSRLKDIIIKNDDKVFNNLKNKSLENVEKLTNFFKLIIDSNKN